MVLLKESEAMVQRCMGSCSLLISVLPMMPHHSPPSPASPAPSDVSFSLGLSQLLADDDDEQFDDIDEFSQNISLFQESLQGRIPERTKQSNQWAVNAYERWSRSLKNGTGSDGSVDVPLLFSNLPLTRINYVLSRFVQEARDKKGDLYHSVTLHNLITGLNRTLKEEQSLEDAPEDVDLLHSLRFKRFQLVLDGVMKERQKVEDPRTRKVETFNDEDYNALWKNSFGDGDAAQLIVTLTFLACKVFALRPDELRRLTTKNFEFSFKEIPGDPEMILVRYLEVSSKNKQGGLKSVHRKRKMVEHYERASDRRGFYFWLKRYLQHCPEAVVNGESPLFQHAKPKLNITTDVIWYSCKRPVGARHFQELLKSAYAKAGIEGDFTLRSVRASVVKELNENAEDLQVIKSRTGHSSDKAVAQYKRPRDKQVQMRVSNILLGPEQTFYRHLIPSKAVMFLVLALMTSIGINVYLFL